MCIRDRYRLEIAELKEKNSELENQHQVWEDKLSSLIQKFETLNQSEDSESVESEDTSSTSDSSYSYGSESESEEESQDDSETSSYSSTTSFGSQAVASSYHYSNQDE